MFYYNCPCLLATALVRTLAFTERYKWNLYWTESVRVDIIDDFNFNYSILFLNTASMVRAKCLNSQGRKLACLYSILNKTKQLWT
jgi:hypothetical protein